MNASKSARANKHLPRGLAMLARMGEEIDRRWARQGHRRSAFPRLADEYLREVSYHREFDEDEVATWVNRVKSLPLQLDPRSSFGQPPLTIWRNERFVLDLYFWLDTETSIHDHSFSGAFTNLSGNSLNCLYDFEGPARIGAGVLTGSLKLKEVKYLQPGDVCTIAAGSKFIHRVWHLDCPTVTLVARTINRPSRLRQYSYFPEGIAIEYRQNPPIEFQRRREFLVYLLRRKHPRRLELANELLAKANDWELCIFIGDILKQQMKDEDTEQELADLIAPLSAGRREWLETAIAAMRATDPLASINWSRLRRTEHRLLIALLNTYTERRPLLEWLADHGHAGDWREKLTGWLSEMDADKALRLRLGSARNEIITQMLRGLPDAAALRELQKTYEISEKEAELLRQGFKRFRGLLFLKPLLSPNSTRSIAT